MKNPHFPELQKAVTTAPTKPGIYRWLDPKGEVLYVGKAVSLRSRLRNYVGPKQSAQGPWKESLMTKAAGVDWTVTRNELEALILETNLIKELKPKYNVMMKDGKNYVYVRISSHETFPSIEIVRKIEEDGAEYFGPYLQKWQIERILEFLHEVFPYRAHPRVLQALNARARDGKPLDEPLTKSESWEIQIGKHSALGTGTYTHVQYRDAIDAVIRFLRGDRAEAKSALREAMAKAAADKKFERAGRLRDALSFIEELAVPQNVSDTSGANTDAIGIAPQMDQAQVIIMRERGGKLIGEEHFKLSGRAESVTEILRQAILQYYQTAVDIPDTILIGEKLEDQDVVEAWLRMLRDKAVNLRMPERGKKSKLLEMAEQNAEERARRERAAWEAAAQSVEAALKELETVLELPAPPARIEGYDISHLGGTETVGSMVVFKNGKAANDEYRSFTIRTLTEGQVDDYAALREVLRRRLRHLVTSPREEEKKWKEQGTVVGKVRKAEREEACKLLELDPKTLGDCIVVRREEKTVGAAALRPLSGNHFELVLALSKPEKPLELYLVRHALSLVKKGKVYFITSADFEHDYAGLGFQTIKEAPTELKDHVAGKIVLMQEPNKHKPDGSLSARPDLIMIDGGKGQLAAVTSVFKELKMDIPIIGLAKREEDIFQPGDKAPVLLPTESQGRFLLMRLRDEAHRFANRHREKRIKNKSTRSALDELPGIGDKTRQTLLKTFGDLESVLAADDEALLRIVSRSQLQAIRQLQRD